MKFHVNIHKIIITFWCDRDRDTSTWYFDTKNDFNYHTHLLWRRLVFYAFSTVIKRITKLTDNLFNCSRQFTCLLSMTNAMKLLFLSASFYISLFKFDKQLHRQTENCMLFRCYPCICICLKRFHWFELYKTLHNKCISKISLKPNDTKNIFDCQNAKF